MPGDTPGEHVEQIYNPALDRPGAARASFLGEACGEDEEVRRDLESLLGQPKGAAARAWALAAERCISAYRVVSKLGVGGSARPSRLATLEKDVSNGLCVSPDDRFSDRRTDAGRRFSVTCHDTVNAR